MGHANYKYLSIVSKHESVLGISKLNMVSNVVCGPCQLRKQTKAKHPGTQTLATSRPLELLHLDLMGPTSTEHLEALCTRLQNKKNMKIDQIHSDHGKEFENSYMESFCTRSGISQEFSAPITPQ